MQEPDIMRSVVLADRSKGRRIGILLCPSVVICRL